jgi:hypothetical protein
LSLRESHGQRSAHIDSRGLLVGWVAQRVVHLATVPVPVLLVK